MIELTDSGQIILNGTETNFKAQEWLPRKVYEHPTRDPSWYLDPDTIALAQFYRDWWGVPIYLNNWHLGGQRNLAGFRLPETGIIDHLKEEGISDSQAEQMMRYMTALPGWDQELVRLGSWWSQHKLSRAFDPKIEGVTADQAREEILDNEAEFMQAGLTTLEAARFAPTWAHSDRRPTGMDHILIVGE